MIRSFAAAAVLLATSSEAHFTASETDAFLYDDAGRVSIFHGANVVYKGYPWYSPFLTDTSNIETIKSWGFNTIRLGVMWSGVEPEMGVYNETYVGIISDILDDMEAHGINAIIDVHQDVLSSYFCEYDGAPKWLVDLSNSSEHAFPWPLPGDCASRPWGSNYIAEATGAAFQDLYDNVNGMRDHFATFWKKLATTFKDKKILGYEIINGIVLFDVFVCLVI
jgi:endoglycosylceramidase